MIFIFFFFLKPLFNDRFCLSFIFIGYGKFNVSCSKIGVFTFGFICTVCSELLKESRIVFLTSSKRSFCFDKRTSHLFGWTLTSTNCASDSICNTTIGKRFGGKNVNMHPILPFGSERFESDECLA